MKADATVSEVAHEFVNSPVVAGAHTTGFTSSRCSCLRRHNDANDLVAYEL